MVRAKPATPSTRTRTGTYATAVPVSETQVSKVDSLLAEREKTYGTFADHARCSQRLKRVIKEELAMRGKEFAYDQTESLSMMLHKIARIVNGDADYIDNWRDIAGYAELVAKRLEEAEPKS